MSKPTLFTGFKVVNRGIDTQLISSYLCLVPLIRANVRQAYRKRPIGEISTPKTLVFDTNGCGYSRLCHDWVKYASQVTLLILTAVR
jgi:hypothetical protein